MSDEEKNIEVLIRLEVDQFEFLEDIAQGLRVGVDKIIRNAVIASIIGAAYPKDEARLQFVAMQARVDKWRRGRGQ